jgi:hypothetical protein
MILKIIVVIILAHFFNMQTQISIKEKPLTILPDKDGKVNINDLNLALTQLWNRIKYNEKIINQSIQNIKTDIELFNSSIGITIEDTSTINLTLDNNNKLTAETIGLTGTITFVE